MIWKMNLREMLNPNVQIHGDTAVLIFNLIDHVRSSEGSLH